VATTLLANGTRSVPATFAQSEGGPRLSDPACGHSHAGERMRRLQERGPGHYEKEHANSRSRARWLMRLVFVLSRSESQYTDGSSGFKTSFWPPGVERSACKRSQGGKPGGRRRFSEKRFPLRQEFLAKTSSVPFPARERLRQHSAVSCLGGWMCAGKDSRPLENA
jgi:hypothetical protein